MFNLGGWLDLRAYSFGFFFVVVAFQFTKKRFCTRKNIPAAGVAICDLLRVELNGFLI